MDLARSAQHALITSPTNLGVRVDEAGSGIYGAKRGDHTHKGVDFVCIPGQEVYAPISGVVTRQARPYANGGYEGVVIEGTALTVKLFYMIPNIAFKGKRVRQGQVIGVAQDVSERHPNSGMKPHIHLEIDHIDPAFFLRAVWGV